MPNRQLPRTDVSDGRSVPFASTRPDRYGLARGHHQFITLRIAYDPTGGLARVGEMVEFFKHRGGPSSMVLDAWIDRRQVICFAWRSDRWLPWFQFHRTELIPHPQLAPIFAELNPVFDAWETAEWFARRNSWLANRAPVEALLTDLTAVVHAARADRFIADG